MWLDYLIVIMNLPIASEWLISSDSTTVNNCSKTFPPSDINECLTNNGNCAQLCNNTDGSYKCSCGSGYALAANDITCTGE